MSRKERRSLGYRDENVFLFVKHIDVDVYMYIRLPHFNISILRNNSRIRHVHLMLRIILEKFYYTLCFVVHVQSSFTKYSNKLKLLQLA